MKVSLRARPVPANSCHTPPMVRGKGPSDDRKRELAITACRRMVSRGERPRFRLRVEPTLDGGYTVSDQTFGTSIWIRNRSDAVAAAGIQIGVVLEVSPKLFDVEIDA